MYASAQVALMSLSVVEPTVVFACSISAVSSTAPSSTSLQTRAMTKTRVSPGVFTFHVNH